MTGIQRREQQLSAEIIEKVLRDRTYWRRLAAELLAESRTGLPEPGYSVARSPALGPIAESRIHRQDPRVPLARQPGPSAIPMIFEQKTIDPVKRVPLLTQSQARRVKLEMNEARLKAQKAMQDGDQDHPGEDCMDFHPNMSHDEWRNSEEGDENHPLFRQNTASARSIAQRRPTREAR
jgi:hypothetical protein